ncbi:MAG: hydantoinase B/oxoprolinase family protein [Desulfurococcales archaeon]|nr:hydantoinase B/oxoprolinase family protein [Desulfurococcales archaeon]
MVDKVTVEVIKNAAIYASEEMGVVLRNTAYSPNIKDRLDHSCAILAPNGDLVAQAEHIPVHLGSMSVGVRNTFNFLGKTGEGFDPGDVVLVNDPYIAGTHLNDLLLMKPVYYNGEMIGIVSNKAHHVDVGGYVPGSIGGGVEELVQEGTIIPPVKIMKSGEFNKDLLRLIESNVRTPNYFKGDLKAQIAALNVGERRVLELASKYGSRAVTEAWDEILSYTERYTRSILRSLNVGGDYEAEDYMETPGGTVNIRVKLSFSEGMLRVDFSGTHSQVRYPINAVYGVTVSAVSFALKTILDPIMPMNQGFLRVVGIYAPKGSLVNPSKPAPVSGGNVETSQRIADVVYRALAKALTEKVPAASCGTMSNMAIGGVNPDATRWAFYETIACGSGGRPCCDGVDAVQTNMTNTLNTPIELLEREYPILFTEYSIRSGSGGHGKYRGGNGVVRAFKVLQGDTRLTVTGERVKTRPWGLEGGLEGMSAEYLVVKKSGGILRLGSKDSVTLDEGDVVMVKTPGGGGYGDPCSRNSADIRRDIVDGKVDEGWIRVLEEMCGKRFKFIV